MLFFQRGQKTGQNQTLTNMESCTEENFMESCTAKLEIIYFCKSHM